MDKIRSEHILRNRLLAERSIRSGTLDDELSDMMSNKWTMKERIVEVDQLIEMNEEIKVDMFKFLKFFRNALNNLKPNGAYVIQNIQPFISAFNYLFVKTMLYIINSVKTPSGIVFMTITFYILYQYPILRDILTWIYWMFFILMYGVAHIINRVNVSSGNIIVYVDNFKSFVDGYMALIIGVSNIKPNTLYLMDVATKTAVNVTNEFIKNATDDLKLSMTEMVTNATDYLTKNTPNVTEIVGTVATVATMAAAANQATINAFVATQTQELNTQSQERLMYENKLLENIVNTINNKIDTKFNALEDTLSTRVEMSVSTLFAEQQQYMLGYFEGISNSQDNIIAKIDTVLANQANIDYLLNYISSEVEIIKEIQDVTIRNEKYSKMVTFTNDISDLIGSKNTQKVIGFIIKLIMNVGPQNLLKNEGGRVTKSNRKRRKRRTVKRKRTVKKRRRASKNVR